MKVSQLCVLLWGALDYKGIGLLKWFSVLSPYVGHFLSANELLFGPLLNKPGEGGILSVPQVLK